MKAGTIVGTAAVTAVVMTAAPAFAAWTATGTGKAAAKAGAITTSPTGIAFGTPTACASNKQQVALSWSAVAGATTYDVEWNVGDSTMAIPTVVTGLTTPSLPTTNANKIEATGLNGTTKTVYAAVRYHVNNWIGPYTTSPFPSKVLGPC